MATQLSWYGSSQTPEWYTEAHVIERVIRVLGVIDLDPCSNPPPIDWLSYFTDGAFVSEGEAKDGD